MTARKNGTVKWFSKEKGYGFIEVGGEEKDIFVHIRSIQKSGMTMLKEGDQVTFAVEERDNKRSAIDLAAAA